MTTTLLKYILKGMLKGIEEYESMLEKEHMDPKGGLAEIIGSPKPEPAPEKDKIDLDDLLRNQ